MNYTHFTNSLIKNSCQEKRLLNLQLGNMFKPQSGLRAAELNSVKSSEEHNVKMIHHAGEELQEPIKDALVNTREEVKKFGAIPGILKDGVQNTLKAASTIITTPLAAVGNTAVNLVSGTTKIATQLITNPVGLVLNIPRMGADAIRLATRPPLIFADYLADLMGRPSKWAKSAREFSIKKIDHASETIKNTCAGIRDKILNALYLGDGGHGHGHAAGGHH